MKRNVIEYFRATKVLLKKSNFLALINISFFWVWLAFYGYRNFLTPDIVGNFKLMYSASCGNLLHVLIYYLSHGIPMIFVVMFLQQPLCEEYFYTRVYNKKVVLFAKINSLLLLLMAIVIIQMIISIVWTTIMVSGKLYISSAKKMVEVFLHLFLVRSIIALFLLYAKLLATDTLNVFTILTGAMFGYALFQRLYPNLAEKYLSSFIKSDTNSVVRESITLLILIIVIILIDSKRDVALQMDEEKNDG